MVRPAHLLLLGLAACAAPPRQAEVTLQPVTLPAYGVLPPVRLITPPPGGEVQFPFPTATGRLRVRRDGDTLTWSDGGGWSLRESLGEPFRLPLRGGAAVPLSTTPGPGAGFFLQGLGAHLGTWEGRRLLAVDGDLDGAYRTPGLDRVGLIGPVADGLKAAAHRLQPLGLLVSFGDRVVALRHLDRERLVWEPTPTPTARLAWCAVPGVRLQRLEGFHQTHPHGFAGGLVEPLPAVLPGEYEIRELALGFRDTAGGWRALAGVPPLPLTLHPGVNRVHLGPPFQVRFGVRLEAGGSPGTATLRILAPRLRDGAGFLYRPELAGPGPSVIMRWAVTAGPWRAGPLKLEFG